MESSKEKKTIYCNKCGSEMPSGADFCENCGAQREIREIKYVKPKGTGATFGKGVAIVVGGFFILIAIPILFGGGAVMGVSDFFDQGGGFIGVDDIDLETSTQMLVGKEMEIHIDDIEGPAHWMWEPGLDDLVTIKIKARSNDGKPVFIGIAEASDAYHVFGDVAYDEVIEYSVDDVRGQYPDIAYRYHSGGTLEVAPTELNIWVAEVSGSGEQTLTWSPEFGNFWVVVMNEDGSANVDVDTGLAVKIPILNNIGSGLFIGGLVLLGLGVAIVYFGAIRPR